MLKEIHNPTAKEQKEPPPQFRFFFLVWFYLDIPHVLSMNYIYLIYNLSHAHNICYYLSATMVYVVIHTLAERVMFFISMSKINYELKSHVLNDYGDLLKDVNRASKLAYATRLFNETGVISYCLEHEEEYKTHEELLNYCLEHELIEEYLECFKILHSTYARTKRLKDKVKSLLLNGDCVFATLTFNDDTLANTTAKTRRTYVSRYLRSFNVPYIANIDFGSENRREHYHAIINLKRLTLEGWRNYGNINVKRIRNKSIDKDTARLSKYISKLSNHCIKETTKRSSLLYSR